MYNFLRLLFTLLCAASFVPQLQRILVRKDTTEIRMSSVLYQLIGATEHFVAVLGTAGLDDDGEHPHWPNIIHVTIIWFLFNALFALNLHYCGDDHPGPAKLIYGFYFFLSPFPVIFLVLAIGYTPNSLASIPRWFVVIPHLLLLPLTEVFWILSIRLQLKVTEPGYPTATSALDVRTLACQAVIFSLDAILWMFGFEISQPYEGLGQYLGEWHFRGGFIVVNSLIFAVGQAMILSRMQGSLDFPKGEQGNNGSWGTRLKEKGESLA